MTAPTSLTTRLGMFLALSLLCAVGPGACSSSSQKVATSKEQGDNSTASDQQQSGLFNFAKSTQAVGLAGGSLLTVIVLLMTLNYRVLMRMIPLVNADEHRGSSALDITPDPGFGSPSLPGSQERKTGGASLSAQKSVSNV